MTARADEAERRLAAIELRLEAIATSSLQMPADGWSTA